MAQTPKSKNSHGFHGAAGCRNQIETESWLLWSAQALLAPLKAAAELPHSKCSLDFMLMQQNTGRNFVKKQNPACLYYGFTFLLISEVLFLTRE
jgi:hypothetical protein